MKRFALCALIALPALAIAQDVVVNGGGHRSAQVLREVLARPHRTFSGSGRLLFPRDSAISESIVIIGRPTYVASRVNGDVVVVGGDLFIHPGARISGRAIAIGGSVVESALARVDSGSTSYRDETYASSASVSGFALQYQSLTVSPVVPVLDFAGLQGLLIPSYDRVDGLSLPIGAVITLGGGNLVLEPTLTYRSRLGTIDPAVDVSIGREESFGVDVHGARETRSNETWIRSDLVNSAAALFVGSDTRNYFRSTNGHVRVVARSQGKGRALEGSFGLRDEEVKPITAAGNVYSFIGRADIEKMHRPNPLVTQTTIGSILLGGLWVDTSGAVISRVRADVEGGRFTYATGVCMSVLGCPAPTDSRFTQITLDGRVAFPTFGTQSLEFRGHGVASRGNVPDARYAYLGGSGTLAMLDALELGGDQLLYVESRYMYPVHQIKLPFAGSPVLSARDAIGSAGVGSLPNLEHEIGFGVGLSVLQFDFNTDVAHHRGSKVGVGISLSL